MTRRVVVGSLAASDGAFAAFAPEPGSAPAPASAGAAAHSSAADALREAALPKRLGIFCRNHEHGDPLPRIAVYTRATMKLSADDDGGKPVVLARARIPLGYLASDHVGYLSYDLDPLSDVTTLDYLTRALDPAQPHTDLRLDVAFECIPFGDASLAFNIVPEAPGNDVSPEILVAHYYPDIAELRGRLLDPPMASMQNPSIADWRVSPSSFATTASKLIGADGCEELLPSNLATQHFRFQQPVLLAPAVRVTSQPGDDVPPQPFLRPVSLRYGAVLNYRTEWYPAGHSLGQMLYSLPLAPAEKVNLAIIDWSRSETDSRTEDTSEAESLANSLQRDRVVSDVMAAALTEKQWGSSTEGGFSLSGLIPDLPIAGAFSFGAASTSSKGQRNLAADTTQRVTDAVLQSATSLRQLRSTVVVQASQAEAGRYETRTIANYNHGHTLTVLYYEVIRHYRVVTRLTGRRPAVFVEFDPRVSWGEDEIRNRRHQLEPRLLDPRLAGGFEALERVRAGGLRLAEATERFQDTGAGQDPARLSLSRLGLMIGTGPRGTLGTVHADLQVANQSVIRCRQMEPALSGSDPFVLRHSPVHVTQGLYEFDVPVSFQPGGYDYFVVEPELPITWGDLAGLRIQQEGGGDWDVVSVSLVGFLDANTTVSLVDSHAARVVPQDSSLPLYQTVPAPRPPTGPRPLLGDFVSAEDQQEAQRLIDHVSWFSDYYATVALAAQDAEQCFLELSQVRLDGELTLADLVSPTPIGADGRRLIFELGPEADVRLRNVLKILQEPDDLSGLQIYEEQLAAVPTRGVFAEAKLGHCNANEVIDDTRFWDWQKSPIPDDAPAIAAVDTSSRTQAPVGLTPTALPQSIVTLMNPQAAPEPSAAAGAAAAVSHDAGFRDMSGAGQLTDLLKGLGQSTSSLVGKQIDAIAKSDLPADQKTKAIERAQNTTAAVTGQAPQSGLPQPATTGGGSGAEPDPTVQGLVQRGGRQKPVKTQSQKARRMLFQIKQAKDARPTNYEVISLDVFSQSNDTVVAHYAGPVSRGNSFLLEDAAIPESGNFELTLGFGGPGGVSVPASELINASVKTGYQFDAGSQVLKVIVQPEATTTTETVTGSRTDIDTLVKKLNDIKQSQYGTKVGIETDGDLNFLIAEIQGKATYDFSYVYTNGNEEGSDTTTGNTKTDSTARTVTLIGYSGNLLVVQATGGNVDAHV